MGRVTLHTGAATRLVAGMAFDKTRLLKIVTLPASIGPIIKKEFLIIRTMGIMTHQTPFVR